MKSNTRLEIGKWVFHEEGLKIDLGKSIFDRWRKRACNAINESEDGDKVLEEIVEVTIWVMERCV